MSVSVLKDTEWKINKIPYKWFLLVGSTSWKIEKKEKGKRGFFYEQLKWQRGVLPNPIIPRIVRVAVHRSDIWISNSFSCEIIVIFLALHARESKRNVERNMSSGTPNSIEVQIDNFLEQFKRSASKAMDSDWVTSQTSSLARSHTSGGGGGSTSTGIGGHLANTFLGRKRNSCMDISELSLSGTHSGGMLCKRTQYFFVWNLDSLSGKSNF